MSEATIGERVAKGAAFLDEHDPEWWRADIERAIDLDRLEMGDGGRCILGQRCPMEMLEADLGFPLNPADEWFQDDLDHGYLVYAQRLSGYPKVQRELLEEWACTLGFNRPFGGSNEEYDALTAEWWRVITERRSRVEHHIITLADVEEQGQ